MNKKYIVRLTDQERDELAAVIKKFKGTSQKVRRAQILSKADADGPNWTDHRSKVRISPVLMRRPWPPDRSCSA